MSDAAVEQISLPEQVVSSVDLVRVLRELEEVDESLRQNKLRKPGSPTKLARSSTTLEELASNNKVTLTDEKQRDQLITVLKGFMQHAPRIHMSVAAEPTANFKKDVIIWLRKNIHPLTLLEIGLQPNLAAGCVVRTNNKVFDMSLRNRLHQERSRLYEEISDVGEAAEAKAKVVPSPAPTTIAPSAAAPVVSQPTPPQQPVLAPPTQEVQQ